MSALYEEIRQQPRQVGLGGPLQGVVSTAPTDETTPVGVMLQQFSENLTREGKPPSVAQLLASGAPEFTGCAWAPRYTIHMDGSVTVRLPAQGDPCLVVLDDFGQAWVVAWWPFGGLT